MRRLLAIPVVCAAMLALAACGAKRDQGAVYTGAACPGCDSDAKLKNHILMSVPGLQRALNEDRVAALRTLVNWTANTVHTGDYEALDTAEKETASGDPAFKMFQFFDRQSGGPLCGGTSLFFQRVAGLFGYPSLTVNIGIAHIRTHVETLVGIPGNDGMRYYIADPWFNVMFVTRDGTKYMDLVEMLKAFRSGNSAAIVPDQWPVIGRRWIFMKADLGKPGLMLSPARLDELHCGSISISGRDAMSCMYGVDRFAGYFTVKGLQDRGYGVGIEAYLNLLVKHLLNLGAQSGVTPLPEPEITKLLQSAG